MLELRKRTDALFLLFFVSGFAGLIYEAIWTHYVKLFLGHAAYAQTLVLVVFIGGLAAGAWICARYAERVRNPLRAYALIEGAIGLVSLVFHQAFVAATDWAYVSLLPAACDQTSTTCLPQWGLAALMLFPQSILLGATFPLVTSAALRIDSSRPGHDVAALYFLNSLGAVFGVLAAAFVLIPAVGLPGTLRVAAFANLALASAAFLLSRAAPPALAIATVPAPSTGAADPERRLMRLLLATAFLTGLSSFIYEIAWIRMLNLVLGATTQSFELMLASFILGLALGGAWVRNRIDRIGDTVRFLAMVQLAMGAAAAATLVVYNGTFDAMAWFLSAVSRNSGGFLLFSLASSAIALAIMLPATFCAGMTLPLITYRLIRSPSGEKALGLVYAVNTVGSILGVIIAVHLLLEPLGMRGALLVGAAIDVALGVALIAALRPGGTPLRLPGAAVAAVAFVVAIAAGFHIDPRRSASGVFRGGSATLPQSEKIAFHRDGKAATVDVIDSGNGNRAIRTNGKTDAAIAMRAGAPPTGDEFTMALLAVLPMGYQPQAKSAAVIGFGSGMSTALMLASPTLQRVDTVEIEPAMVEGARLFRPLTDAAFLDPRSHIVIDDAKSYFARGRTRYDIIVSEPSNPWVSGVASLFTEEFYGRMAAYLNEGGVLSQWLHTYEMDSATFASIILALSKTFPQYVIYGSTYGDLIVIARKGGAPGRFDPRVLDLPALRPTLERLKLTDARPIERRMVGGSEALTPLFAKYGIPANSDFFPVVDQRSAKARFMQTRVMELHELRSSPVPMLEMLGGAPPPARAPFDSMNAIPLDGLVAQAWRVHEVLGKPAEAYPARRLEDTAELSAQLARSWSQCRTGLSFAQVLPALVVVAKEANAYLAPEVAGRLWEDLAKSPCGRKLAADERRWLELFGAIARRDAEAMLAASVPMLEAMRGVKEGGTELAFLAATTAALCVGNAQLARMILEQGADEWVRPGAHFVEVRFLDGLVRASRGRPMGTCAAPAG